MLALAIRSPGRSFTPELRRKKTPMSRLAVLAALVAVGLSSPALAQTAEEEAACRADFQKFCQGVMPGGGRIVSCLANHKDKISSACKKVVDAHSK
jgi:Cysteine rich repeat